MSTYRVVPDNTQLHRQHIQTVGSVKPVIVDLSAWADDNGALTSATWSVQSGQASLSSASRTNNVCTVTVTTSSPGTSMLRLVAASTTNSEAVYVKVSAIEPTAEPISDCFDYYR